MDSLLRRSFLLVVTFTIIILSLNNSIAEPRRGGEVVISVGSGSPSTLNTAVASGYTNGMVSTQLFASPLRYDANWNPKPYLARSWKVSESGLSITLNLVKGAVFHDGRPITSADVVFSIMTIKEYGPYKNSFNAIERIDTPDPHTAIIWLKHPHPAILLAMSPLFMPIMPKHIYGDGQDFKTHPAHMKPVGSGPFIFVKYEPGKQIVLKRNHNFFIPGRPFLDKIVFRIESDPKSQSIEMERQEAHLMTYFMDTKVLSRLRGKDHLAFTKQGYQGIGAINWLAFNLLRKPLDDKRVRQAIAYAADREFITEFLHEGRSQVATGPIAPANPFYEANVSSYKLNLPKANKLLDEAGYPRKPDKTRFVLTLEYPPLVPSQFHEVVLYLKQQLEKVGIDVKVQKTDNLSEFIKDISNWNFDMAMDLVSNLGDPVLGVQRSYLSNNIVKGVMWSNTQNYRNARVDELLEQAAVELNVNKRRVLYSKFQKIVTEELPVLWINVVPFHTVYNKGLENLPLSIWGILSPLDELYWKTPPKRKYVSIPTMDENSSDLKKVGVRAIKLIQERGQQQAINVLKEPNQGFLDLEGSGLHVIGFTQKGIVFLDNSDQMKPGLDISRILDLEGKRMLPQFLDASKGKNKGLLETTGVWPHPKTHEVGPMSAWCTLLTKNDVICILRWD